MKSVARFYRNTDNRWIVVIMYTPLVCFCCRREFACCPCTVGIFNIIVVVVAVVVDINMRLSVCCSPFANLSSVGSAVLHGFDVSLFFSPRPRRLIKLDRTRSSTSRQFDPTNSEGACCIRLTALLEATDWERFHFHPSPIFFFGFVCPVGL